MCYAIFRISVKEFCSPIAQSLSTLSAMHRLTCLTITSWRIQINQETVRHFGWPSIYSAMLFYAGIWPTTVVLNNKCQKVPILFQEATKMKWYISDWSARGFIIGFCMLLGYLDFQSAFKVAYFRLIDDICDKMHVQIMIDIRWFSLIGLWYLVYVNTVSFLLCNV